MKVIISREGIKVWPYEDVIGTMEEAMKMLLVAEKVELEKNFVVDTIGGIFKSVLIGDKIYYVDVLSTAVGYWLDGVLVVSPDNGLDEEKYVKNLKERFPELMAVSCRNGYEKPDTIITKYNNTLYVVRDSSPDRILKLDGMFTDDKFRAPYVEDSTFYYPYKNVYCGFDNPVDSIEAAEKCFSSVNELREKIQMPIERAVMKDGKTNLVEVVPGYGVKYRARALGDCLVVDEIEFYPGFMRGDFIRIVPSLVFNGNYEKARKFVEILKGW